MGPWFDRIEMRSRTRASLVAIALLLAAAPVIHAQNGTITGRVTEARSTQPVAGATLEIEGARLGAVVDAAGRYRITNVPPGTYVLIARRIGYVASRQSITTTGGQTTTADFVLQPAAVELNQVVVTGTAGGERLRTIGNSVATINAVDAVSLAAPPNFTSLLNSRAPGVIINQVTGRLGASPNISIRGVSSLNQGNSPLIYIDGVRVNSSTGQGAANGSFAAQGSSIAGRLNDINPEDIESIEVIKGPAASTIYGTEATNGVIQIITKKGAVGASPDIALQLQYGSVFFRDAENRVPTNYMKDATGNIVAWNAVKQEKERGTPLFRTGDAVGYTGSLSGGRDQVRYYASGAFQKEQGIEPNNYTKQFSLHSNLDVAATDKIDFAASVNYVDLRNHLGTDQGLSAMLGATVGHILLQPKSRGFGLGYPPELSWQLYDNMDFASRFTSSGTATYRPFSWMTHRLLLGLDYTGGDTRTLERFATPELATFLTPTQAAGRLGQRLRRAVDVTVDYSGTANAKVASNVTAASSVGLQAFRHETNTSDLGGQGFPAPGVETISGAATPLTQGQSELLNTTVGAYAQEKFGWRDRLFVTGAVRVDNNSAFGEDFKWITYPKADISWVVNEEPFWKWGKWINTLRLRAAYGASGQAPNAFSALRTFSPIQGPGGTNAVTPGSLGNPNLKPEVSKELEYGFEMSLFDRLSIDFTKFSKKTTDEIVNQSVAPSSGFPGSIPMNLGRVDNSGYELLATYEAIKRPDVSWVVVANLAASEDIIRDLGSVPGAVTSSGGANRVGYPINGIWTKAVVYAERNPTTGAAMNVMCDGGDADLPMPCAQAPFVYIGRARPKTTGAISNTLTLFKNLRLYALVDFKSGYHRYLQDRELRCTGAGGAQLCEENLYPERFSPIVVAEVVGTARAQNILDQYYPSAGFAKLREVSASYLIPARFVPGASSASITISGRELALWSKYNATDPENNGQAIVPPLSRITATLNIRF